VEISFKFLAPLRQVDLIETEIYKYLETIYFLVQRTNMAENKQRNLRKDLFLFEICFVKRLSEFQISIF